MCGILSYHVYFPINFVILQVSLDQSTLLRVEVIFFLSSYSLTGLLVTIKSFPCALYTFQIQVEKGSKSAVLGFEVGREKLQVPSYLSFCLLSFLPTQLFPTYSSTLVLVTLCEYSVPNTSQVTTSCFGCLILRLPLFELCLIGPSILLFLHLCNNINLPLQVSVSAGLEHPFFVFGRGWASCDPHISMTK